MYYLYRIAHFLAVILPRRVGYVIATCVALICYYSQKEDREALKDNIRVVLNRKVPRRLLRRYTRRSYINFAKYLIDFLRFSVINKKYIKKHITIRGNENIDKCLKEGKGVILLSSHLGNWELGAVVISSLGYKIHAIALDHQDKRVNRFFLKQRRASGVKVIQLGSALKQCLRVLKNNELLAILGDRDFTNSGEKINFFKKEAVMPKGPAFFSLKTGAPIVVGVMVRKKNEKFEMIFDKPIYPEHTGNIKKDIPPLMVKYMKVIEKYIKAYPDQWYVFRRVWNGK